MNLTIFSINLWNTNKPIKKRMDALIAFLKATNPDIILLQEVSLSKDKLQSLIIKDSLAYSFHMYSESGLWKNREEGIAIISKVHPFDIFTYDLKSTGDTISRKLQLIRILIKGKSYTIANTHLAYSINATSLRNIQARKIRKTLMKWDNVILGGDLNCTPDSPTIKILTNDTGLIDVGNDIKFESSYNYTISSNNPYVKEHLKPNRRIDYFLVSENLDIIDYRVVLRYNDKHGLVSDHYGLLVKIKVKSG